MGILTQIASENSATSQLDGTSNAASSLLNAEMHEESLDSAKTTQNTQIGCTVAGSVVAVACTALVVAAAGW